MWESHCGECIYNAVTQRSRILFVIDKLLNHETPLFAIQLVMNIICTNMCADLKTTKTKRKQKHSDATATSEWCNLAKAIDRSKAYKSSFKKDFTRAGDARLFFHFS